MNKTIVITQISTFHLSQDPLSHKTRHKTSLQMFACPMLILTDNSCITNSTCSLLIFETQKARQTSAQIILQKQSLSLFYGKIEFQSTVENVFLGSTQHFCLRILMILIQM